MAGGARTLDDLDFAAAARLLREVPELLGECRCQSEAEWVLGVGLRPHEVILVTGQEGDRLTRGDLITAGSLMMDNAMAGQDDRLLEEEGREALRSSTWMHRGALPKREELEMEGARLSEAAREMMSPIAELREAAGDEGRGAAVPHRTPEGDAAARAGPTGGGAGAGGGMTMEERRNLLYPWDIAVWTGDQRDIIPPEEMILAGCLYSMGYIDAGDDHFTGRGIEVLRGAIMAGIPTPSERALWGGPTHWKAVRRPWPRLATATG